MKDGDCVSFLQETLPRLRLRWPGFRRVRRQVCKRLQRRLDRLQLPDLAAYRQYLDRYPPEWQMLDDYCRITITRFYRDRGIFRLLEREASPRLTRKACERGEPCIRAWSAGCGTGEEPYTLAILWALAPDPAFRHTGLEILATETNTVLLQHAGVACYPFSSIRELPSDWRDTVFCLVDDRYCLHPAYRQSVNFKAHDIRSAAPEDSFDLVLCRNLAFTYYDTGLQRETARKIASVQRSGGLLVLGAHERLPDGLEDYAPWREGLPLYRRQ